MSEHNIGNFVRKNWKIEAGLAAALAAAAGTGAAMVAERRAQAKALEAVYAAHADPLELLESDNPTEREPVTLLRRVVAATFLYDNGVDHQEIRGVTGIRHQRVGDTLHAALRLLIESDRPLLEEHHEGERPIIEPTSQLRSLVDEGAMPLLSAQIHDFTVARER